MRKTDLVQCPREQQASTRPRESQIEQIGWRSSCCCCQLILVLQINNRLGRGYLVVGPREWVAYQNGSAATAPLHSHTVTSFQPNRFTSAWVGCVQGLVGLLHGWSRSMSAVAQVSVNMEPGLIRTDLAPAHTPFGLRSSLYSCSIQEHASCGAAHGVVGVGWMMFMPLSCSTESESKSFSVPSSISIFCFWTPNLLHSLWSLAFVTACLLVTWGFSSSISTAYAFPSLSHQRRLSTVLSLVNRLSTSTKALIVLPAADKIFICYRIRQLRRLGGSS